MKKDKPKKSLHEIDIMLDMSDSEYDKMNKTLKKYYIEDIALRDDKKGKDYTIVIKIRKND